MRPTTSTKGVLRPQDAATHVDIRRYPAVGHIGRYVERFWAVHWDLRGQDPYAVELIPHPCVNLSFPPGVGGQVHGVHTHTSVHPVAGVGRVFGVKFRPGGFAAFSGADAATLTGRDVPLADVFGPAADALAGTVLAAARDEDRIGLVDAFLCDRLPSDDGGYDVILGAISTMLDDRTVTRVDHAASRCGVSVRTLQRLFRRYIGVSPKWVIRRYRMHDGAELLASDTVTDPATMAVQLGWFDQAHFTRDFTALIGMSPVEYAAACRAAGDREPVAVAGHG
jgi:AraC-like DNA-binding protein